MVEQRLLRRVLGEIDVAQDPVRHRVESVADGDGEAREGLLVAALRPNHQSVSMPLRRGVDLGWERSPRMGRAARDDSMAVVR